MDVQIPPVFYKTSSSFGAKALLQLTNQLAGQGYRRPSLAFGRLAQSELTNECGYTMIQDNFKIFHCPTNSGASE